MIAMRRSPTLRCTVYEPTARDIRRECKEIQATWSPRKRAKRSVAPRAASWFPPSIRLSGLLEAVDEEQAGSLPYFGATGNEAQR
jgi:hypothetical protein